MQSTIYHFGKYPGDFPDDNTSYAVCNSDDQKSHLNASGQISYSAFYSAAYLAKYVDGMCGFMYEDVDNEPDNGDKPIANQNHSKSNQHLFDYWLN